MSMSFKGKSLLTLKDLSPQQIANLIDCGIRLKEEKRQGTFPKRLANLNICGIFLKPSTRTRASFLVASADEGAHFETFGKDDVRFGIKESIADIARVFGRIFNGIAFRGFAHWQVEELAKHAGIPVWNGLTDYFHPTQVLADFMTIKEEFGKLEGIKLGYVGDAKNNVLASLLIGAQKMGVDISVVAPPDLQPDKRFLERVGINDSAGGSINVTADLERGLDGCDVVYTDVWVSMGDDVDLKQRAAQLQGFKITPEVMELTHNKSAIFLHCLPSIHNESTEFSRLNPALIDTSEAVFEGPQSRVFGQSENRMHTIKAVMVGSLC